MNTLIQVAAMEGANVASIDISMGTYLMCALTGIIGIALHVFLVKMPSAERLAKSSNVVFDYRKFFKGESKAIISAFLILLLFIVCLDVFARWKPEYMWMIKVISGLVGFFNSAIFIGLMGKFSPFINGVIDVKTNELDGYSISDKDPHSK